MFLQSVANGLTSGCVYALFALGFGLSFRVSRFFNFSHGGVYVLAAYCFYALVGWYRVPAFAAFVAAVATAAALGAAIEEGVYQPMRARGLTPTGLLVASLGVLIVIQNAVSLIFGDAATTIRTDRMSAVITFGGVRATLVQAWVVVTTLALYGAIHWLLQATNWGRMVRALANDELLSRIVGVPVRRVRIGALGLASGLAAISSILAGFDTDLTPSMGLRALLFGMVAAVVGGVGSVPGSLFGGLLVGLLQHLGVWQLPTQWQDAIIFVLLIGFLLFRPQGMWGASIHKRTV